MSNRSKELVALAALKDKKLLTVNCLEPLLNVLFVWGIPRVSDSHTMYDRGQYSPIILE